MGCHVVAGGLALNYPKACCLGTLLLCAGVALAAQDPQDHTTLFLGSTPLKALLTIDGEPAPQRTPVLIQNLEPGNHTYVLSKEGCVSASGIFELSRNQLSTVWVEMERSVETDADEEGYVDLIASGDSLLADGKLLDALATYTQVFDARPDSPLVPEVLYKIAKIHTMTENVSQAVSTLKLLVAEYPVVDLYDRAQKNLADLHYELGFFQQSINHLDQILYSGSTFTPDAISRYRNEILGAWSVQLGIWPSVDRVTQLIAEREDAQAQFDRALKVGRVTGVGAGITFSLAAGAAAAAVISFILGDIAYRRYSDAVYTEDTAILRSDVELFRVLTVASGGAAAAGLAGGLAFALARPKADLYRLRVEEIETELDELLRRRQ